MRTRRRAYSQAITNALSKHLYLKGHTESALPRSLFRLPLTQLASQGRIQSSSDLEELWILLPSQELANEEIMAVALQLNK
jgi:hypothetical protein